MVNECIDDVTQHKRPGSAQSVLHLSEQQADKQVVHHQYAVPLVAVGGLSSLLTDCYENPLNGHLKHTEHRQMQQFYKEISRCSGETGICKFAWEAHRSLGQDGDQRLVIGTVAFAQVLQRGFDHI